MTLSIVSSPTFSGNLTVQGNSYLQGNNINLGNAGANTASVYVNGTLYSPYRTNFGNGNVRLYKCPVVALNAMNSTTCVGQLSTASSCSTRNVDGTSPTNSACTATNIYID